MKIVNQTIFSDKLHFIILSISQPSNIFISEDKQCGTINIQLGDFGLACPAIKESHSDYKGTELYAAPEQMDGFCNKKVKKLIQNFL